MTEVNIDRYKCKECRLIYKNKNWAEKCEAWCKENKSCNLEITKYAVKLNTKKYNYEHNNNAIEKDNGKIKDRIKNIRSGFKSFNDAKCFMDLRRTIYNFVNPHQELNGKTPAEIAKINLNLGRNKLLDLIKYVKDNYTSLS